MGGPLAQGQYDGTDAAKSQAVLISSARCERDITRLAAFDAVESLCRNLMDALTAADVKALIHGVSLGWIGKDDIAEFRQAIAHCRPDLSDPIGASLRRGEWGAIDRGQSGGGRMLGAPVACIPRAGINWC